MLSDRDIKAAPLLPKMATPGRYAPQNQQWEAIATSDTERSHPTHCTQTLTIATLNVWFGHYYFEERCAATLELLAHHRPDLITLQEVTPEFLYSVLKSPWVQAEYQVSDIRWSSVDPYGVLILSRIPVDDWQIVPLPSVMGRSLATISLSINNTPLTVASVHLESKSRHAPTRAIQLEHIFQRLAPNPHVLLTGDFNFCSSSPENQQIDSSYQDVWPMLHPTDPGFTEDTDINLMRLQYKQKHKQVRFDRIFLRSQPPGWKAEAIALIGTDPIHPDTPHIFPSDHFGLMGQFVWTLT